MKHEISLKSTVTKGVICVTSTKLNPFGRAVSERYLPEFKKKRLVTSLALPLQYLFFVTLSHAMLFLAVKANYLKCKNVSSNEADPGISNSPVWARSGLLFPVLSLAENLGSGNFADSVVDCPRFGPGPPGPGSGPDPTERSECLGQSMLGPDLNQGFRARYYKDRTLGSDRVWTWPGPTFSF